ncbi:MULTISPECIES: single-stranded DNA-binding protein [Clostridium]|jgi:single stranded DNA-binding protein (ssb)|uniref:Single-stranded DNA-binding protein n=4 Tax=Clostridium TaxID=1485 RepID=A0A0B5QVJ2_CLOBE|nr:MULTISPECIES: single-stranded DNA-binding protein [Clostridium]ABR36984.1 single-strand binding protein [Clostridium beijerinckii NCIMB 8052]AIU04662.1 single-strand binding protein [Clostridium beijerinckii ATCC 35702]AJH01998.1 single-stranded DNA-binding protein [Clostridium beijerinckii]AQS07742.1 single-stranded DNA-binding protein A [Clostridium beijerinckii]AVK48798.1 single-stranded DNA-binding protein [Clostridium sp. MF28]
MNKIILLGRLVKDPELRHTENGEKIYTKFTIAVQRNFRLPDGIREADFIPIKVWGKKAEVIVKYMKKGSLITLSGRLRTGSYEDKEGNRKYIAEVIAEDFKFLENKKSQTEAL